MLDLCGSSAEHFDVPPDELIAFAGDADVKLPYGDAAFDDVICSGGVGSLTRPRETFAEVARVLRPGGRFVCTFAARCARPGPYAAGYRPTTPAASASSAAYFSLAGAFGPAESDLRTSLTGTGDRLWAVWAARWASTRDPR